MATSSGCPADETRASVLPLTPARARPQGTIHMDIAGGKQFGTALTDASTMRSPWCADLLAERTGRVITTGLWPQQVLLWWLAGVELSSRVGAARQV